MVYVFADTRSLSGHRPALKSAFNRLHDSYKGVANIRVAGLRHGGKLSTDLSKLVESGSPYLFSSPPNLFKEPSQLTRKTVSRRINALTLNQGKAFLYPAIEKAREMIVTLCPSGKVPPDPQWCKRKIIVVLGDGIAGRSELKDFNKKRYDPVPEKLLSRIDSSKIELHTFCVGVHCGSQIYGSLGPDVRDDYHAQLCANPGIRVMNPNCIGYLGKDVMQKLAERTGGEFDRYVP